MANEKQEIVLEIQVQGSIDGLAKLRTEMDTLIKTRQELTEKSKAGDIEATKEIEKVNSAVRNMQTEYKAQQRVLDGYNASVKSQVNTSNLAANSIQQNRDLLKQLTAQYIQLKTPSANATSQIKHLSDVLKEQEAAIGNTTRNVGNYGKGFNEVTGQLVSLFPALEGLKTAQLGVNAAMEANPIGLIVVGIQALTAVLSQFKPIVEAVEKATAGMSAGFSALINGGNIIEAATEAARLKEELNDLEDSQNGVTVANAQYDAQISLLLIKLRARNITEKEASKISEGIQKLSEERFKKNADQQEAELKNSEDNFKFKFKLNKEELDALVLRGQTQDILSEEEEKRLDKLSKDSGITKEQLINNAKEVQKFKAEQAEKNAVGDQAELQTAIKNIAERRAAILGLAAQRDEVQQKTDNLNERLAQRFLQQQQVRDAAEQKRLENEAKRAELEASLYRKTQEEKLAALKKFDDDRKKKDEQQIKDAQAKYDLESAFLQKKLEIELGYIDLSNKSLEEKQQEKDNANILFLERQLQRTIDHLGADGDITKAELQGIEAIRLKLKQARAEAAKPTKETYFESLGINSEALGKAEKTLQGFAQIVSSINDIVTKGFQIRENEIESQKNHEIEAVQSSTIAQKEKDAKIRAINKAAAEEKYQLELQAFNTSKGIQIVQAIISTALGVVNGLNAGLSLGPAGVVMGPVLAALAGVTGAVQIALIASQQPPPKPSFATGVIGLDGEGTETSDSIDAKLSRGESVMTARATKKYHRELAYMEMSVGNSPNYKFGKGNFAGGFIPTPNVVTSDGGFAARDIARNSDNSALIQNAIKNGFALAPAPVLSIVEFQDKQNSRNRSVQISEA